MKSCLSITSLLILLPLYTILAQTEIEEKTVLFTPGTSSAVVNGTLAGDQIVDYKLTAHAGQTMHVLMNTDHSANYFNVLPPGSNDEAIFTGQTDGNEYSGVVPENGTYKVRVYLMRSAARRNEKAMYSIEFNITGPGDAKVSGTRYHVTGMVGCSVGPDPKNSANCRFGVIRDSAGQAEVHVAIPGGENRVLIFSGDKVACQDPLVSLKSTRESDSWSISINAFEFFTFPDAVIYGG